MHPWRATWWTRKPVDLSLHGCMYSLLHVTRPIGGQSSQSPVGQQDLRHCHSMQSFDYLTGLLRGRQCLLRLASLKSGVLGSLSSMVRTDADYDGPAPFSQHKTGMRGVIHNIKRPGIVSLSTPSALLNTRR